MKYALLAIAPILLAGCAKDRVAVPLRPDLANPERMVCEGLPENRPELPAKAEPDWQAVMVPDDAHSTLERAQNAFAAYSASMVARNRVVVAYIQDIEGKLFVCSNNAQWWRDYFNGLP